MKKVLLLSLIVVTLAVIISLHSAVTMPQQNFEQFMQKAGTVVVGKTTLDDERKAMSSAHIRGLSLACEQQDCNFRFRSENSLLHSLGLAPRTVVDASLGFKQGVASEIYIALVTARKNDKGQYEDDRGVVIHQSSDPTTACHLHYNLSSRERGTGDVYWATVAMDSCVSPENRAKALAIEGSCLSKLGGCKGIEAILPQVLGHRP